MSVGSYKFLAYCEYSLSNELQATLTYVHVFVHNFLCRFISTSACVHYSFLHIKLYSIHINLFPHQTHFQWYLQAEEFAGQFWAASGEPVFASIWSHSRPIFSQEPQHLPQPGPKSSTDFLTHLLPFSSLYYTIILSLFSCVVVRAY